MNRLSDADFGVVVVGGNRQELARERAIIWQVDCKCNLFSHFIDSGFVFAIYRELLWSLCDEQNVFDQVRF